MKRKGAVRFTRKILNAPALFRCYSPDFPLLSRLAFFTPPVPHTYFRHTLPPRPVRLRFARSFAREPATSNSPVRFADERAFANEYVREGNINKRALVFDGPGRRKDRRFVSIAVAVCFPPTFASFIYAHTLSHTHARKRRTRPNLPISPRFDGRQFGKCFITARRLITGHARFRAFHQSA